MKRIRIPVIYKRLWNYFGALFFASIVFIGGCAFIYGGTIKLADLNTFTGIVTDKGVISFKTRTGSPGENRFFFKIKGLRQPFALLKTYQDYSVFNAAIDEGDSVTVYFINPATH